MAKIYPNIVTCTIESDREFNPKQDENGLSLVEAYHNHGIAHRISSVVLYNDDLEVLLQKRSSEVPNPNKWDVSAAGHVEVGSSYRECAITETVEETGIYMERINANKLKSINYFRALEPIIPGKRTDLIGVNHVMRWNMVYAYKLLENQVPKVMDKLEVKTLSWVSIDELKDRVLHKPDSYRYGGRLALESFLTAVNNNRITI